MIYVLTEWNGKGSGDSEIYKSKSKAMIDRQCTLTYKQALKKYGKTHFRGADVKCSSIDSYTSMKQLRDGKPRSSNSWY